MSDNNDLNAPLLQQSTELTMLKSKLAEDNENEPQLQFESLDVTLDHAQQDSDPPIDLDNSHNVEMHEYNEQISPKAGSNSKLKQLSASITSKIKSTKMKKGGFEKIDDYDSDKDDAHMRSPKVPTKQGPDDTHESAMLPSSKSSYFDLKLLNKTCQCTKRKTIVCIAGVIVIFLIFFIIILAEKYKQITTISFINCMKGRKVLIISLDGFRAEYLSRIPTPNIDKYFIEQGVSAKSMKPVFPSKTFPNHYTIVTGLYPPSHGIVSNHFWDPILHKTFDIQYQGNDSSGAWFQGEPIWNTIKLKHLTSAALQYPGSNAKCGGRVVNDTDVSGYPTYYRPHYHSDWEFNERIDLAVELLTSDTPNYDLVLLYFEQPDHDGHKYGPGSDEVFGTVSYMDEYIGSLMSKLRLNHVLDTIDVILLSDHGMTSVERYDSETYLDHDSRIIVIDENIFPFDSVIIRDWTPVMGVYLNASNDRFDTVEQAMDLMENALVHNEDRCNIYKNGDIPYKTYNDSNAFDHRIPDFIVSADLGYQIFVNGHSAPSILGTHGYNNSEDDMHAIFMARGPSFKSGVALDDEFENIHLYEIFCSLLCDVQPNDNNGTRGIYSNDLFNDWTNVVN